MSNKIFFYGLNGPNQLNKSKALDIATSSPSKTATTPTATATETETETETSTKTEGGPAAYLKSNFSRIEYNPVTGNRLPTTISITKATTFEAIINGGYEPKNKNNNLFTWLKSNRQDLNRIRLATARLIDSVIDYNTNPAATTKKIHTYLETTEKGSISFNIGNIATYLTAQAWLNSSSENLDLFLHERLYCSAKSIPTTEKEKHADYIAITNKGNIHIFESKGGADRGKSIVDGLAQLEATAKKISPISYVCVHAKVAAEKEIEIVAYDPPGNSDQASNNLDFPLDIEYLRIAKAMNAIDLFNTIQKETKEHVDHAPWRTVTYNDYENFRIAIPTHLLEHERILRTFLILNEYKIEIESKDWINSKKTDLIITKIRNKLGSNIKETMLRWHFDSGRHEFKTLEELLKITKKNSVIRIENLFKSGSLEALIPPYDDPTDFDFILSPKGLLPAKSIKYKKFPKDWA